MISKITKKLQLTGPTSPSRSAHNERSLQRLWGYIIIVFKVWKFEIQTQEGRTKPLSSYYWQWPPVLFSFLSIGMNSFQKAQAEARGPSPVPELFIWKLMICKRPKILKCLKLQKNRKKKSATSDVPVPDVILRLVPVVQRPVVAGVAHGVSDTNTSLLFGKYVCLMFV